MTNNEWEEANAKLEEYFKKMLGTYTWNLSGQSIKYFIQTLLDQTKQDTVKEVIGKITDVVAYKKKGPVYAEAVIEIINQLRSEYKID